MNAELLVVGGGVIGLSIAFEAQGRGVSTCVVEAQQIGSGAAGVAAGMLTPWCEVEVLPPALLDECVDSVARYPAFIEQVERLSEECCALRDEGTLLVAVDRRQEQELERIASRWDGSVPVEWMDGPQVRRLEPRLSGSILLAARLRRELQVDPRRLLRALAVAFVKQGGQLQQGTRVHALEVEEGRIAGVATDRGTVRATHTVVAAGAWSTALLASVGVASSVRPVKGQILRLRGTPLLRHVVRAPNVYLVPREDGELVVGATSEEAGFDSRCTAGGALELLWEAARVLPDLRELELCEVRASLRPASASGAPLVGPTSIPGLSIASGHHRHGVLLAPATARRFVDVLQGRA